MKDVFGNDLEIGDTVAFYAPGYRSMCKGIIIAFTPKQVRVEYMNTWNYSSPGHKFTYLNYPSDFAKKIVQV
jgi:hypothetical protein